MTRLALLVVVSGALAVGPAPHPGRGQSASIAGVVVSAGEAPVPVRRAVVTLTGAGLDVSVAAITGDDGGFEFRDLPAGVFTVVARKAAYLPTSYGATGPGRPGTPVTVAAGGRVSDLRIVLPRGAVIAGAVRDATGAPAAGVAVTASRAGGPDRVTRFAAGGFAATTDDRGEYRIFGLPPGRYVVGMTPHRSVREVHRMRVADVDSELRALEARRTGRVAPPLPKADLQPQVYAPVFYPGTPISGEAERIMLATGETRDRIDFTVDLFATSVVEGTVSTADGSSFGGVQITLLQAGPPLPTFNFATTSAQPGPDGRFEFLNVTPGRYVLLARRSSPPAWGLAAVTVRGEPRMALAVQLRAPMSMAGRVVFDAVTLTPPRDMTAISVGLRSPGSTAASVTLPDGTAMTGVAPPPPATVGTDGRFAVEGILPGVYVPVSSVPGQDGPSGWWLRSATLDGRDLLDRPLVLGEDSAGVGELVLMFTDRHSALTGRLVTAAGAPATGYVVVALPADRDLRQPGSRRIRFARPATDGVYAFRDLPAGRYLIAALSDLDPADLDDRTFLDELVPLAVAAEVRDGETTTQDLAVRR